ncbi:hypothetical protein Tco_0030843 [Tanacetum coccineum]
MSSYNRRGCFKCGGPFGGLYCRQCTCERCRRNYTDEVCALCCYEVEKSFVNDSNPNSFIDSPNIFNPPPQPQTYSCEFCGNNAHYGYDCPPQVPFIYNPEPCYNQDFDNDFPQISRHSSTSSRNEYLRYGGSKAAKKLQQLEQVANLSTYPSRHFYSFCYNDDDDDDGEFSIPMSEVYKSSPIAITPVLPTDEPDNSLSMRDEHLSTIQKTESNELIKYSVENLVPIPSESEDFSDIKSECDVPVFDNFTTFSNPLFDADDDFSSNPHHIHAESDLIESLLNRDILIVSSAKFDSILEEFSGELAHIDLISLEIDKADFDPEEEIHLVEKLLYDNSSPRPPEELNFKNSDVVIESFSPSPIPVEDSDSLMEEIDIFLAPDDSIPPGIENDDYDSEGDILFLGELLTHDPLSLLENESFHFDRYYVPSSPRPPEKSPDDDDVYFDIEPDTGVFTKVVDDISDNLTRELYVYVPNVLPALPTLSPMFDTLLPFSFENDDKIFNPRILVSNEEKSPHLLSHRGFKAFQVISDFSESPMIIYGGDSPILDVPFLHLYPP